MIELIKAFDLESGGTFEESSSTPTLFCSAMGKLGIVPFRIRVEL